MSAKIRNITSIDKSACAVEEESNPISATWNVFTGSDGVLDAGIWSSDPCRIDCNYDYNEVCVIIKGRVRLTDEEGNSQEFSAGQAFAISNGFRGVWETLESLEKFYVIQNEPTY